MGKCLGKTVENEVVSSASRFSEVRKTASEVNGILIALLIEYLNMLIHGLLKAGKHIWTDDQQYNDLNLVRLGVWDMMRGRVCESESNIRDILKILSILLHIMMQLTV